MEYAETVFHLAEIHVATKKNVQAINCLDASIRVFELSSDGKNALIDALEQKAGENNYSFLTLGSQHQLSPLKYYMSTQTATFA